MAGGEFPPNITQSRAYGVAGGSVSFDYYVYRGSFPTNTRGLVYNKTGNLTDPLTKVTVSGNNGPFSKTITGLTAGVEYHFWGFVTYTNYNTGSAGTSYSAPRSFIAGDAGSAITQPEIYINNISNVAQSTADVSAAIFDNGGAAVTERGFVWSKNPNPTVANSKITVSGASDTFSAELAGLAVSTLYHVRAYATNSKSRAYSDDQTFKTMAIPQPVAGDWKITIDTSKGNGSKSFGIEYVRADGFNINWGDGSSDLGLTGSSTKTHTYATAGTYTITMTGDFTQSENPLSDGSRVSFGAPSTYGIFGNPQKVIATSKVGGLTGLQSFSHTFSETSITTIPEGIFDQYGDIVDLTYCFKDSLAENVIPIWWTHSEAYIDEAFDGVPARDLAGVPEQLGGGGSGEFIDPVIITRNAEIVSPPFSTNVNRFNTLEIRQGVVARFSVDKTHHVQKLIADGALLRAQTNYEYSDEFPDGVPVYAGRFSLFSDSDQTINNADIKDSKAIGATWRALNSKDSGNNLGWIFNATDNSDFFGDEDGAGVKAIRPPVTIDSIRIHQAIAPFAFKRELRPIAIDNWSESIEGDTEVEIVIEREAAMELISKQWSGAYSMIVSLISNTDIDRTQLNTYEPYDPYEGSRPTFTSNIYDSYYVTRIATDEKGSNYRMECVGAKGYLKKRLAIPAGRNSVNGSVTVPDGTVDAKPIPNSHKLAYTGKSYKGIIAALINETRLLQDLPIGWYSDHSGGDMAGTVQRTYLLKDFLSITEAIDMMIDDQGAPPMIYFDGGFGDRSEVRFFFEVGKNAPPDFSSPNIWTYFYKGNLRTQINDRNSDIFTPSIEDLEYKVTNNLWSVGNAADGNVLLCHKVSGSGAVLLQEVNTENSDIKTSTYLLNYTNGILARSGQSVRTMTLRSGRTHEMFLACVGGFIDFTTPDNPEIDGTHWRIVHRQIKESTIEFDLAEEITS